MTQDLAEAIRLSMLREDELAGPIWTSAIGLCIAIAGIAVSWNTWASLVFTLTMAFHCTVWLARIERYMTIGNLIFEKLFDPRWPCARYSEWMWKSSLGLHWPKGVGA